MSALLSVAICLVASSAVLLEVKPHGIVYTSVLDKNGNYSSASLSPNPRNIINEQRYRLISSQHSTKMIHYPNNEGKFIVPNKIYPDWSVGDTNQSQSEGYSKSPLQIVTMNDSIGHEKLSTVETNHFDNYQNGRRVVRGTISSSAFSNHQRHRSRFSSNRESFRNFHARKYSPNSKNLLLSNGLQWDPKPAGELFFSNNSGGVLNCRAREHNGYGNTVWIYEDGEPISEMNGLTEFMMNGSLHYFPFSAHLYDSRIHSARVKCLVSVSAGVLLSHPVEVMAVLSSPYQVEADDELSIVGNTAVLKCRLPPHSKLHTQVTSWTKDETEIISTGHYQNGKYFLSPSGNLHVMAVTARDATSRYRCTTRHTITQVTSQSTGSVKIIVDESTTQKAPVIRETKMLFHAMDGDRVFLPCIGQGNPPPDFRWFKDGHPLLTSDGPSHWAASNASPMLIGGSLMMSSVSSKDSGEYRCQAMNELGSTHRTFRLTVSESLKVQIIPSQLEATIGNRLAIRCKISGSFENKDIEWYKNGEKISQDNRVRILNYVEFHINSVEAGDSGIYQCMVSTVESTDSAHIVVTLGASAPTLKYKFIAHTLQPGPAVTLKCIARGTPTPNIAWSLDGFPTPQSDRFLIGQYVSSHGDVISHLNITSVRVPDGGLYECRASNSIGEVSHSARLNIYGSPLIRPIGHQTAVAGQKFTISCPVGGYPIENIEWFKDEVILPTNHKQKVDSVEGTLEILDVNRFSDEGRYTCTAYGRQGFKDTQDMHLVVVVPPLLGPLVFPVKTRSGMRAQSTCFVQEGDQPINISWEKDGERIVSSESILITQINDFTSMITILNAVAHHSGNYTCVASNKAATVRSSAKLAINVAPHWISEPKDVDVVLGEYLEVKCSADGFPPPEITWQRETVSGKWTVIEMLNSVPSIDDLQQSAKVAKYQQNKEVYSISDNDDDKGNVPSMRINVKDSLILIGTRSEYKGQYLCKASNGVGSGISKVIKVVVNEPPRFATQEKYINVEVNSTATLTCMLHGDEPLSVQWLKNGKLIPSFDRLQSQHMERKDGVHVLEITITSATSSDSGDYVCSASNNHGSSELTFTLAVQDVPKTPSDLTVENAQSRLMTVSWNSPVNSRNVSQGISTFILKYRSQEQQETESREILVLNERNIYNLTNLRPSTWYIIQIAAENRIGRSSFSPSIQHRTLEEKPSTPPRNIKIVRKDARSIELRWDHPDPNGSHGRLLGYYLGMKKPLDHNYNFTTVGGVDISRSHSSTLVKGLMPYTEYEFTLQAFNTMGAGPSSKKILVRTAQDKPSAPPQDISCEPLSSTKLFVKWKAPPSQFSNGAINEYKIKYISVDNGGLYGPVGFEKSYGAHSLNENDIEHSTMLEKLQIFSNYSIKIAAATEAGLGVYSKSIVCSTEEGVPLPPHIVKAVASGHESAIVSWSKPLQSRGILTHYSVNWIVGDQKRVQFKRVDTSRQHLLIRDLPNEVVTFWLTSSTVVGTSHGSKNVTLRVSSTIPAAIWSLGGDVSAVWREDLTLPCHYVGVPKPHKQWTLNGVKLEQTVFKIKTVTADGSLHLESIGRNHSGMYSCEVTNSFGSDSVSYNLTVFMPPSEPILHITETTSSSIRLQWEVVDTGGMPAISTTLYYRDSTGATLEVIVKSFSHTVYDLKCGTQYDFYSIAHNKIGSSESSSVVRARTKGRPPEAPPKFQFITSNSSQVTLYLSQWEDGGCPILYFNINYRKEGEADWDGGSEKVLPRRTFIVSGLEGSQTYAFRVTAVNSAGPTTALYEITTPKMYAEMTNLWNSYDTATPATGRAPLWKDIRLVIPVTLSSLALLTALVKLFLVIRNQRRKNNVDRNEDVKLSTSKPNSKGNEQQNIRQLEERPVQTEDDTYHYATNDYQFGDIQNTGGYGGETNPKSYSSLVYQDAYVTGVEGVNQCARKESHPPNQQRMKSRHRAPRKSKPKPPSNHCNEIPPQYPHNLIHNPGYQVNQSDFVDVEMHQLDIYQQNYQKIENSRHGMEKLDNRRRQ